jgi:hypothetical protein
MKRIALALLLAVLPLSAHAGAVYTGSLVVPIGSTVTLTGSAAGCALFNSSSILYQGICPSGTAAFVAGTNITITGSNPYTINCPLCFTTAGGTIGATTVTGLLTTQAGVTNTSTSVPIISGASGTASSGFKIGSASGYTQLSATATSVCGGVTGNALTISSAGTPVVGIDTSGNLCATGTIYYTSDPNAKYDIQPANINGLDAITHADFNLSWRYKGQNQVHYGPMATSLPAYIAGPKHDHIDTQALATTEAIAIQQLSHGLQTLWFLEFFTLFVLVLAVVALFVVARAKYL